MQNAFFRFFQSEARLCSSKLCENVFYAASDSWLALKWLCVSIPVGLLLQWLFRIGVLPLDPTTSLMNSSSEIVGGIVFIYTCIEYFAPMDTFLSTAIIELNSVSATSIRGLMCLRALVLFISCFTVYVFLNEEMFRT